MTLSKFMVDFMQLVQMMCVVQIIYRIYPENFQINCPMEFTCLYYDVSRLSTMLICREDLKLLMNNGPIMQC